MGHLFDPVLGAQGQRHRQVRPRVAGQILDQLARDLTAIPAGQRQGQFDILARLGLGGQAEAAIDRGQIQRDHGIGRDHAMVVLGAEILDHPAVGPAHGGGACADHRRLVRQNLDLKAAPGQFDAAAFLGADSRGQRVVRQRGADILRHLLRAAVKAEGQDRALGQDQFLALGQGIQVKRRAACIGGRLGPALP